MNIYLLKRIDDANWKVGEARGFVVIAIGMGQAGLLASEQAGDEGADVWRSVGLSTCELIGVTDDDEGTTEAGQHAHVVLRDYYGD